LDPVSLLLRLERARRKLQATDPNDKKKLLEASRRADRLIVEYYRAHRHQHRGPVLPEEIWRWYNKRCNMEKNRRT